MIEMPTADEKRTPEARDEKVDVETVEVKVDPVAPALHINEALGDNPLYSVA